MPDYRYRLERDVAPLTGAGRLCWIMLNPSRATDTTDDQTTRQVQHFTRAAGYARLTIVNLFAARCTNPKDLVLFTDPVGTDNNVAVYDALDASSAAVCAWGDAVPRQLGSPAARRILWTLAVARELGVPLLCLGTTKAGMPRHPCRLGHHETLQPFE